MTDYVPQDDRDLVLNPTHCKAATPSFMPGRFFQCQRKAGKDGYCWQHQPERVAAREEKSRQHRESSLSGKELRVQRNALLDVCECLVNNLPDEIFEWIGDTISWSNVSAIKAARDIAASMITFVKDNR